MNITYYCIDQYNIILSNQEYNKVLSTRVC